MYYKKYDLLNEIETEVFSKNLAETIKSDISLPNDDYNCTAKMIYIQGDLGTGKTTIFRNFLREFGITDKIKSPTYTILEIYKTDSFLFYHFDFYRLNHPEEFLNIDFRELLHHNSIILVEWPEKASQFLPSPDLYIELNYNDADLSRHMIFKSCSKLGQKWLNAIVPLKKI